MRVISLVPSWTETLLAAGVHVVGRTRYCVHPPEATGIPAVGGTKDWKLEELQALRPDLVLVDQEENLPFMAEAFVGRTYCSHVQKADDVPPELRALGTILNNDYLINLAAEWAEELSHPAYPKRGVDEIPGITEWIRRPNQEPEVILYLIWRGPWMSLSRETFVGSLLNHVGYGRRLPAFKFKYPKIDLSEYDPEKTLLLFATEPYPFAAKKQELYALDFPAALVDGEVYSWFGLRSLRFLQSLRSQTLP